jgi:eukaryotic-like serine/threonine-protein kinase
VPDRTHRVSTKELRSAAIDASAFHAQAQRAIVGVVREDDLDTAGWTRMASALSSGPTTSKLVAGRYVVLEHIGEGAMGAVVRAYDPKLRREVALKIMRARAAFGGSEAEARMLREAQALARLSDPHVVAVYDAELTEHGVCIAMEYVEGQTLRAWTRARDRRWWQIVEVVTAAARGLAAVHAAGVVHRDVKPDNVLVSHDGRVRLADFGVARARDDDLWSDTVWTNERERGQYHLPDITQQDTVVGTPAYMAPEQHVGRSAEPRSDQYALCVMLWEALHGERPFRGADMEALLNAKRRGPPERHAKHVPQWLHAALVRGLAADVEKRWPSVDVLVDVLVSGRRRTRRRRSAVGFGLVACVIAAGAAWQRWDRSMRIATCERAGEAIAVIWNDDARETLRAALVGTNVSYAEETAAKVMPWLDEYARSWQGARFEACMDATVAGTWDANILDRSVWCLDERRMKLEALLRELSRAEPETVENAVPAAAALTRVEACLDADLLERLPSPPSEHREEIRETRVELSRANALQQMGSYEEALILARGALARAEALGWPPLVVDGRIQLGISFNSAGNYAEAEGVLETAYFEAIEAGVLEGAATAADELVATVGYRLARTREAVGWARHAEGSLRQVADLEGTRMATHFTNLGLVHHTAGAYEEAKDRQERALAIREEALGPEHPLVASSLLNLGLAHQSMGAYAEAESLFARALAIQQQALGPEHPAVALGLNNVANVHHVTEAYPKARALYEQALTLQERALGPEHPDVARTLTNLGSVRRSMHDYDDARALYERALSIREKTLGAEHPDLAGSLNNLANLHLATKSYEEARTLLQRALAIWESALGPEHFYVGVTCSNLGSVHAAQGEDDEAKAYFERSLAVLETALGVDHPDLAHALIGLARTVLVQGKARDAVALSQRAVKLRETANSSTAMVAEARYWLARSLWEANDDEQTALALAEQAREGYREAGSASAESLEDVQAWLRSPTTLARERRNARTATHP